MRSNRAGVTIFLVSSATFRMQLLQVQLVALQHLTGPRVFMSSRVMPSFAELAPLRTTTLPVASRAHAGSGLGRITTATTPITGVRWIVFA